MGENKNKIPVNIYGKTFCFVFLFRLLLSLVGVFTFHLLEQRMVCIATIHQMAIKGFLLLL